MGTGSLASLDVERLAGRLYRVATLYSARRTLEKDMGLSAREASAVLGALPAARVPEVRPDAPLDDPFRRRRSGDFPFGSGRYSDGSFGVLYSAEDEETAKIEASSFVLRRAQERGTTWTLHKWLLRFDLEGDGKDLTPFTGTWPELTARTEDSYPTCQRLGREAKDDGLDALRVPSARRSGGVCVPVLSRDSVSNEGDRTPITITADVASDSVSVAP